MRARRGETGDAQQPLVDHRQGVGHGPSAALGHRHRQGAFRAHLAFRADVRHQAGGRVVHQQRRDAVEADRPVVVASGVGLQQRHVDVDVGRHGGGDRHFQSQGVALLAGFQPVVVEHPGAVFQAHQQAALAAHRHLHAGGVAHLIVVPVGAQRQPGGGVALGAAFAAPAQIDGAADAVAAVALADPQQVPAPLVIGAGQGPLGAPVGVGGEGVLAQFFGVRVADEVGQVVVAAVPPPAPVDAVQAQGQVAAGLGLAVLVQRQEADLVVPVAAQGAAPAVAFRHAHAHPVPVGAHRYAAHLGAVVAAVFEHPGGERGGGHARRGQFRQVEREARVALVVELAFEGGERLGAEAAGGVVEGEAVVAFKSGGGVAQAGFDVGFQAAGAGAVEPLAVQGHRVGGAGVQGVGQVQFDAQPVGLDRLDPQRGIEITVADPRHRAPVAGGRVLGGAQGKGVELPHRLAVGVFGHLVAARVEPVQGQRVVIGNAIVGVVENKGEMDVVARAPHVPFAVEEALEAVAHPLAAGIELVGGQRLVARQLQVAAVVAMVGDQIKRCAVHARGGFAVAVGGALGELLVLVVVHGDAHAAGRRVAVQMGGHHDQPVVLALLGDQAQVGGQEGA